MRTYTWDWDEYYEKFYDWAESTQVRNLSALTSLGSADEAGEIMGMSISRQSQYVIYEQEQSGQRGHGVSLSKLSRLAQTTYRGKYCKIDKYDFLVFYYTSNSRKTSLSIQCELDENRQLRRIPRGYYLGQWHDSADEFVEKANQHFSFR